MDRIFVQIASYRDPECQWTVKDLFEKATHPDRIFVGICWQYDPEEDKHCFEFAARPEQVRISPYHWKEGKGVCWARHEVQALWEGEEYTLFIDSHMRFEPGWDVRMIEELAECPSPKAVLTNHPAAYTPPDNLERGTMPTVLRAHPYSPEGDIRFRGDFLDRYPDRPLRGAFIAAGFIFARGEIIRDVPYDPYLYFNQEELSLAARFFTHGYDVYSPRDVLIYHNYHNPDGKKKRPLHWDDFSDWVVLQERARRRLDHLLGHTQATDPLVTREIERYGLGTVRSLAEYEAFCGIDFKRRIVSERALRGGFIDNLGLYKDQPIFIPEVDAPETMPESPLFTPEQTLAPLAEVITSPDAAMAPSAVGHQTWIPSPHMRLNTSAPKGVLIIDSYIDASLCDALKRYADAQSYTDLDVVDHTGTTKDQLKTQRHEGRITHHVHIDGMAFEIMSLFNDIYFNRLAPFYNVDFEWYERPQILRYPAGGKYDAHADADQWLADNNHWMRVQDRDYSVLLYLNDEYEGGELELIGQKFKIKPKPGMLLAFPSDHRYLHAALPTTSGIRYVIVSWAAIVGSPRVRTAMPYASVFMRQSRSGQPHVS